jgi:hypothetical protein
MNVLPITLFLAVVVAPVACPENNAAGANDGAR